VVIMKEKKELTVKAMKERRTVPEQVREELKQFNRIKKQILGVLKEEAQSIPQLADKTGLSREKVTYYLMTLLKYHDVDVDEMDENDEYYTYKTTR